MVLCPEGASVLATNVPEAEASGDLCLARALALLDRAAGLGARRGSPDSRRPA